MSTASAGFKCTGSHRTISTTRKTGVLWSEHYAPPDEIQDNGGSTQERRTSACKMCESTAALACSRRPTMEWDMISTKVVFTTPLVCAFVAQHAH